MRYILKTLTEIAAFAVANGAIIYVLDKPLKGFTNLQSSALYTCSVFVAVVTACVLICLLDEALTRRENR